MRLVRRLDARAAAAGPYVAAIGGFDGIHLGHRALIARTRELARSEGLVSMVLSFEPLPKEFFAEDEPPARLTSLRERWRLLEETGCEVFCVLRFDAVLRALNAAQFASLLAAGGVRIVVIGHDFRAGHKGEADARWFQEHGSRFGLAVQVLQPVHGEGIRVGSGAIRGALAAGDLGLAARLLGRSYSMRGRVVAGDRLGRTLGFPTANLRLARRRTPLNGIFAVRVRGVVAGQSLDGVASLGTRPTVGGREPLLEAHVFDYAGDLYGRELEVEFVARLRDELRFDGVDAMLEQMQRDAAAARALLAAD
jgi:riboflavin kinase / FMN adenylyltransferase